MLSSSDADPSDVKYILFDGSMTGGQHRLFNGFVLRALSASGKVAELRCAADSFMLGEWHGPVRRLRVMRPGGVRTVIRGVLEALAMMRAFAATRGRPGIALLFLAVTPTGHVVAQLLARFCPGTLVRLVCHGELEQLLVPSPSPRSPAYWVQRGMLGRRAPNLDYLVLTPEIAQSLLNLHRDLAPRVRVLRHPAAQPRRTTFGGGYGIVGDLNKPDLLPNLTSVLQALDALNASPPIRLVGFCTRENMARVRALAADRPNIDTRFLSEAFLDEATYASAIADLDVFLFLQAPGSYRLTFSGVFATILGEGKPFLSLGNAFVAGMASRYRGLGRVCATSDELAAFLAGPVPQIDPAALRAARHDLSEEACAADLLALLGRDAVQRGGRMTRKTCRPRIKRGRERDSGPATDWSETRS